jgi:dipeptidyl aminopeptidase/acylaminoacyl peptidase
MQLYVMPMAGGDALQVTKGKDGISQFAWSPDGASIAYATADPKPELKGEDKFRTAFKVGNDDITVNEAVRPVHLWLVAAQGGEPKRLTHGTWSLPSSLPPGPPSSPIAWSRDGKSIVFVRQETPSTGDQFLSRIQVLDVASGEIRSLTGAADLEGYPVVSPDGSSIAYWRNRDARPWNYQDVWLASWAGGSGRDISAALDKNVYLTHWSPQGDCPGGRKCRHDGGSVATETRRVVHAGGARQRDADKCLLDRCRHRCARRRCLHWYDQVRPLGALRSADGWRRARGRKSMRGLGI